MMVDGVQKGWKKIMVLYTNLVRGGKPEKTYWKMHQYHLGTGEDEMDGEFVISKIFYDHQQQQLEQGDKNKQNNQERVDTTTMKVDPPTPESVTPDPPCAERRSCDSVLVQDSACGGTLAQVKLLFIHCRKLHQLTSIYISTKVDSARARVSHVALRHILHVLVVSL